MIPSDQVKGMIDRLEKMNGPDAKGCYLGNDVTPGVDLRSKELAECLRELLTLRNENPLD